MISVTRIFQGDINPNDIVTTDYFVGGLFLMFVIDEPDSIGYDFGISLLVEIPLDQENRIEVKDVILPSPTRNVASTFDIVYIPEEYSRAKFQCYCGFNSNIEIRNLRCYVVTSDVTLDDINIDTTILQEILERISQLQTEFRTETLREIADDIASSLSAQQTNFGLGILSASLAPVTLGASASAVPLFGSATAILAPVTIIGFLP